MKDLIIDSKDRIIEREKRDRYLPNAVLFAKRLQHLGLGQVADIPACSLTWWQRSQYLSHLPLFSQMLQQEAGLKVKQLGLTTVLLNGILLGKHWLNLMQHNARLLEFKQMCWLQISNFATHC